MTPKFLFAIIATTLLVASVSASLTMVSVNATNREAIFIGTCDVSPCWFEWGSGTSFYWTTPNQTITGTFSDTQLGAPMLTSQSYNVAACDASGSCSAPLAFDVPDATMVPLSHYGDFMITVWRSGFNITQVADIVIAPYAMTVSDTESWRGDGSSIVWGIFFFFIFVGYWLRGKNIAMPSLLAILSGMFIIGNNISHSMGGISIEPVFVSVGMPLLVLGIAGMIFSWFTQ